MNERIEELADEATTYIEPTATSGEGWIFDKEKFAELIVRECAQVCNNIDAEYEGEDVLATWCATAIKQHFGVEE